MKNKSAIKYYKVVDKYLIEQDFHSCSLDRISKYALTYKLGELIKPPIGGIFAFRTLKHAINFCRSQGFYYILKGIGRKSRKRFYKKSRAITFDQMIEEYWAKKVKDEYLMRIPTGTILLAEFRPEELIKYEYGRNSNG